MRTYHGFSRRQTKDSLENGKSSRHLSGSDLSVCDSARDDHPYRPESSIHNTSCASSVDAADNDDDGSFSEDESDDSIEVENEAGGLRDGSKVVHSEADFRYSHTGNESNSKLRSTCKPYVDGFNSKGPHPDDDGDTEEGRWAQQTNRRAGYHGAGGRGNVKVNKNGHKTSGISNAHGKQGSLRISGDEEMRPSSSDLGVSEFAGCLNSSAPRRARTIYGNSAAREVPFESRRTREYKIGEPVSGSSTVNANKVIDVHIVVSPVGRNGSVRRIDEDRESPMYDIRGEFPQEDFTDNDALDSDRIPSADIFKVLDNLNLSTSAMKPPTPGGDRFGGRRVQSAGYTRRKPPVIRGEKPMTKGDKGSRPASARHKGSRPASAKQVGGQKTEKSDWVNSSEIDTASSTFGGTEGVVKYSREKIPGYFTEQYKKILDEKNAINKQTDKIKTEAVSSSSLGLVPKESAAANSCNLNDGEEHDHNKQTSLSSDYEKDETSLRISNSESTFPSKVESLSDKQERYLKREITSRSSSSGVFITTDNKSELRSVNNADGSSSGVDTMSSVTDCSSIERFVGASDRNNSKNSKSVEEVNNGDDDAYCDEIDDGDDDSDDGCLDDFDGDDVSSLEVVAKQKTLSESRFV